MRGSATLACACALLCLLAISSGAAPPPAPQEHVSIGGSVPGHLVLPVVDVNPLVSCRVDCLGNPMVLDVINQINDACKTTGFFQIVGHGLERDVERMNSVARTFFGLSHTEKMKLSSHKWNPSSTRSYRGYFPATVHGKEGLDIGDPRITQDHVSRAGGTFLEANEWPSRASLAAVARNSSQNASVTPDFRVTVEDYYLNTLNLAKVLLKGILGYRGMNLAEVDAMFAAPVLASLRLNYYAARSAEEAVEIGDGDVPLSCETHTDGAILTLLYQDNVGGLQAQLPVDSTGVLNSTAKPTWVDVPVVPGAFVVNTGVALQRLLNDEWKATNHRVVVTSTSDRLSIPFFVEPNARSFIGPLPCVLANSHEPAKYPYMSYNDYLVMNNKRFKEYRRTAD